MFFHRVRAPSTNLLRLSVFVFSVTGTGFMRWLYSKLSSAGKLSSCELLWRSHIQPADEQGCSVLWGAAGVRRSPWRSPWDEGTWANGLLRECSQEGVKGAGRGPTKVQFLANCQLQPDPEGCPEALMMPRGYLYWVRPLSFHALGRSGQEGVTREFPVIREFLVQSDE